MPLHKENFQNFHKRKPQVYRALICMARQYRRRHGLKKIGIATFWEDLRHGYIMSSGDGDFKLDNTHRAYYARLIMAQEPDLAGIFRLREQVEG